MEHLERTSARRNPKQKPSTRPKCSKIEHEMLSTAALAGLSADAAAEAYRTLLALGVRMPDLVRASGRTDAAVRRILARADANAVLSDGAAKAAKAWVRATIRASANGDHRPAEALLQAVGAVDRPDRQTAGGVTVQIGVALPGTPGAPLSTKSNAVNEIDVFPGADTLV